MLTSPLASMFVPCVDTTLLPSMATLPRPLSPACKVTVSPLKVLPVCVVSSMLFQNSFLLLPKPLLFLILR